MYIIFFLELKGKLYFVSTNDLLKYLKVLLYNTVFNFVIQKLSFSFKL